MRGNTVTVRLDIDITADLLVSLSPMFPETLILGLEIRVKVSSYVQERIKALRSQNSGQYNNVACLRTNAMKYLPNYFKKHQVHSLKINNLTVFLTSYFFIYS